MPDKVVLVRHGPAQARGIMSDYARALTTTGRRLLEEAYPEPFGALLPDGATADGMSVWTSTMTRALQTAEVICDVVGIPRERIVKFGALTAQDENSILNAILRDGSRVLVVVGHSPSLDAIASTLSSRLRIMTQGEALCIDMSGAGDGSYPVLWSCQPTLAMRAD